eukprot:TRINITY_DN1979_c0_g1_i4.p1 TRINITY_DN1979_c0_g1~~TRINITY_DN1979_c0_g1_i4.p1  ORF type:complete len:234 (-),score=45.85 TRINITY_DN1979_c0_g1_i4:262-963(-)
MEEIDFDLLVLASDEEEEESKNENAVVLTPKSNRSDYLGDPTKQLYSQKLGRWVGLGQCLVCGLEGHRMGSPSCPEKRVDNKRRHWAGKISCVQRATRFMKWIFERWDVTDLSKTGVLDIAGGQGKLAFELQLSPGRVPCLVIDPRAIVFSEKQQTHFDFQTKHSTIPPSWPAQKQMLFEDNFLEDPSNLAIFNSVSLVVGMHPDEATERIIQFGLQHRKSFAVLPCCVFPNK